MRLLKKQKGLTFVEILVTIAIVSLLMAVSYPAYDAYIKETNAKGLKSQLIDMSNDFDRIKRKTYTYKGILKADGTFNTNIAKTSYPRESGETRFTIEVKDVEHSSYKIIATPVNAQGDDYGKISFEFTDGELKGLYDSENDNSWSTRWY